MAGQHVARQSLQRDSERPLCEATKLKPGLQGRPNDVGDPELRDICQGELHTGSLTSPTQRHMFQATKTGGAKQSTLFKTLVPGGGKKKNFSPRHFILGYRIECFLC